MYTVCLPQTALVGLKRDWLAGCPETCDRLFTGVRDIKRRLAEAAPDLGETREGGERVIVSDGVMAAFEVFPERGIVRVLRAWADASAVAQPLVAKA
jgi:hypothetical protein